MSYRIRPSDKFDRSIKGAEKQYYKKNARAYAEFLRIIGEFLSALEEHGGHCPGSEMERHPDQTATPGWDLRKFYFTMPEQRGASREGRILFAVNKTTLVACPILFYTHQEFTGRPAAKDLTALLKSAIAAVSAQTQGAP